MIDTNKFKEEVNITLASSYTGTTKEEFELMTKVLHNNSIQQMSDDTFNKFISIIKYFKQYGIISALTLKDDEFEPANYDGNIEWNKRYHDIVKFPDGKIYNMNAYNTVVISKYNYKTKTLTPCDYKIKGNFRLYIRNENIVTPKFIYWCEIPKKIVNKGGFTLQSVVNIPALFVYDGIVGEYTISEDNPKLKALKSFYNVEERIDTNFKPIEL